MNNKPQDKLLDKAFRNNLRNDPKKAIQGIDSYNKDISIKVVTNTKDKVYVVFPSYTQDWSDIRAGVSVSTAGSAGSVGTASTLACVSTNFTCVNCFSSASSAGTIGTAGSVKV